MALEKYRRSSRSTLNYTNRRSLAQTDVAISVDPARQPLQVRLNQLVVHNSIPDDAHICVEVYRSATGHYERLGFGEAKAFKSGSGAGKARPLARIKDAEGLRFRVKATDSAGRLLAEADGLRSIEETGERAIDDLFPVIPKSLDGELWRVAFSPDGPELWVEKSLDQAGVFLWTLPAFQSLVLPAALGQVAERMIRNRDEFAPWFERWRVFLGAFDPGFIDLTDPDEETEEPSDDEIDGTVSNLASAFARRFKLLDTGAAALQDGGAE